MRGTLPAGAICGIPIRISPSWFVAVGGFTVLLGLKVYPAVLASQPAIVHWALGLASALIFFLSILLHELGHALVARQFGVPVRGITLFLLGGVAQITREVSTPGAEALIAGAGPAISILLGGAFLGLMFACAGRSEPLAAMFALLGLTNVSVGVFNLLPGFPMDGGRLFRAGLWAVTGSFRRATAIAGRAGRFVALGMVAFGVVLVARLPGMPFSSSPLDGLWLVMLGLYLDGMARQTLAAQRMLDHLRGFRADQFMQDVSRVPVIAAGASLLDFLPSLLAERDCEAAFVAEFDEDEEADGGRMVGMVVRGRAITVPERERGRTRAADLMLPAETMEPAHPEDDAASLLQRFESEELAAVPVVADGRVLGLIARRNLIGLIERRARL
jgi:Zn-dependent protease